MIEEILNRSKKLEIICENLQIGSLHLFGSAATGQMNESSDLDFLLKFKLGLSFDEYANNYFEFHFRIRELFGKEIDVITHNSISNPYFKESINKTKRLIYESSLEEVPS